MSASHERSAPRATVRRLDPILVDRIAAGEVVERPASAVKELVENAIDAGARSVEVAIEGGGRRLIRVIDDGIGMGPEDLELAVERHATSKIPDNDLTRIGSLGFRGEALPSIGAVSRLVITSRTADGEGVSLTVDSGLKGPVRPAPASRGTRIEVTELFAATPARLKFLKSDRAESAAVSEIIRRLAVAQPQVRFTLRSESGSPTVFPAESEPGQAAFLRRLGAVLGPDFPANAVPVDMAREGFALQGHVGLPTFHRGAASHIHFVVNGRPVRDRLLLGAVRGAFADTMSSDRHPVLALALTCEPGLVDVNVHPAKTELRFREPGLVRALIVSAIHEALRRAGARSSSTGTRAVLDALRPAGSVAGLVSSGASSSSWGNASPGRFAVHSGASAPSLMPRPASRLFSGPSVSAPAGYQPPQRPGFAEEDVDQGGDESPFGFAETPQALFSADLAPPGADLRPEPDDSAEIGAHPDAYPRDAYPLGAARAQIHETYILAQTRDGIVLVDQHAAHERLVYERLKRERAGGGVARQGLLIPDVVEMAPEEADRLVEAAPELERLGLSLEAFGPGAVLVRAVPAALAGGSVKNLVLDVLDALEASGVEEGGPAGEGDPDPVSRRLDALLSRMSCHGSIRAGRRLKPEEMNALLREMEATPLSGSCNHGRPTFVTLGLAEIERLFGRR